MPFDQIIARIVATFREAPQDLFHERELHAVFFGFGRGAFDTVLTRDRHRISLFRHEYETIWLYQNKGATEPFVTRYPRNPQEEGFPVRATTGTLDFVLLDRFFVQQNALLTVINKLEHFRAQLRPVPGQPWARELCSQAIEAAVEFKMAHRRHQRDISQGQLNLLRKGMLLDCRKLARERIPASYVLGFSHGPRPTSEEARDILLSCHVEFAERYDGPPDRCTLRAMIATPIQTYLSPAWPNGHAIPGVTGGI